MNKLIIFILICIVFSGLSHAEDDIKITRQAEAYFEAKEFDKSRELFEKLEGEKLFPWQKARLLYNIGTTYLEQGKWEEAAREYDEISDITSKAYFLNRALKTNQAVLQYRQVSELMEREDLNFTDYIKAIHLLRDAIRNIQGAEDADCLLSQFMGIEKCEKPQDLVQLRSAVKRELSFVLKGFGEARIADSSVKDGVPYLLEGVNSAESHLSLLESKQLEGELKKSYLKLFSRDAESWLSLWEAQLSKSEDLEEAYQYYLEGLRKMKNEEFDESRIAFLSSEASLTELIQNIWGMNPLVKLLQNLLTHYERALLQVPIQAPSLFQIVSEQKHIEELDKGEKDPEDYFEMSNIALQQSIEDAMEGKPVRARFFVHEAMHLIRRLLRTKTAQEPAPDTILEDAIEDQAHALTLLRLNQELAKEERPEDKFIFGSQEVTLETVAPFISAVMKKEIEEYPIKCQCKPWDKVIPLFEKGDQAAAGAMELIKKGQNRILAMKEQEKAVKYWREALDKLRHPEEEKKQPPPPEEQQEPPPEEEQPQPEPEETPSINEVLRLLQKMSQDDRRPKPSETPPQQGLRPW